MDNRPVISIKLKIILLMSISLLLAVAFYTYFAINLFSEDKKAYIYENSLSSSTALINEINSKISILERDIEILDKLIDLNKLNKAVEFYSKNSAIQNIYSQNLSKFIGPKHTQDLEHFDTLKYSKDDSLYRFNEYLIFKSKLNNLYFLDISFLQKVIDQNRVYSSVVYNSQFDNLFGNLISERGFSESINKRINSSIKDFSEQNVVKTVEIEKNKYLYSTVISNEYHLKLISIIDYQKAFFVTDFLIKKSILFGFFILFLISAIAILFSRSITGPIQKLFDASKRIATGDFDTTLEKLSNDEIGHLGNAFNFMSQEIKKYMIQMQEKIRLENEIKVAKMVQENFFPTKETLENEYEISAFNEASSECGGDWWGFHQLKSQDHNKLLFLIADATGHGVPAALLTSSINTAFNAARSLLENGQLKANASDIMNFLNNTLSQTKTEILLTCFVGIVDFKDKTLNYSNSSHMDPFVIPQKNVALEKSDIVPLIEAKGARLGKNVDFSYTSYTHQLVSGDIILLQTDGLIECKNEEGSEYGMRKLIKAILTPAVSAKTMKENILNSFKGFCKSSNYADDITLVCIKIK